MATAATADGERERAFYAGAIVNVLEVGDLSRGNAIAIKRMARSPLWSDRRWAEQKARFIERATLQQAMATTSPAWMPISAIGDDGPDRVTYSTLRATLTGDALVAGRCVVGGAGLRRVVLALVQALTALRSEHDRPHGNLRLGNVLFLGDGPIARRDVKLADPVDAASLATRADADDDLREIGGLLHAFATGLPCEGSSVADLEAWRRVGPEGYAWRDLCAALLTGGVRSLPDLDAAVRRIGRGARRHRVTRRALATSLALVAAVGSYAAYSWAIYVKYDADKWHELVDNSGWFHGLDELYRTHPELFARDDPTIRSVRDALDQHVEADPFKIAGGARGRLLSELRDHPDASITGSLGAKKTKRAVELIELVRQKLSDPKLSLFVTLNAVLDLSKSPTRQWSLPATYAQLLLASLKPGPANDRFASAIEQALTLQPRLDELVRQAAALNDVRTKLASITKGRTAAQWIYDSAERAVRDDLQRPAGPTVTAADASRFVDGVSDWVKVLGTLNVSLEGSVDQVAWDVYLHEKPFADATGRREFERIAETVRDFVRLSDSDLKPIAATFDDAMLGLFDKRLANLAQKKDFKDKAADLRARRDALAKQIALAQAMAPVRKYLKPLTEQAAVIRGSAEAIGGSIGSLESIFEKDAHAWLNEQRAINAITSDPTLNAEWPRRRDAILARYGEASLARDVATFAAANDDMAALRAAMVELANVVPQPPPIAPAIAGDGWSGQLAKAAWADQRPRVVADMVSHVSWQRDVPTLGDPASIAAQQAARESVDRWSHSTAALVAEMRGAEQAMDSSLVQPEEPATENAPTLGAMRSAWAEHPALKSADARQAAAAVTRRIDDMLSVAAADRAALLNAIQHPAAGRDELGLAAWRQWAKRDATATGDALKADLADDVRARDSTLQFVARVGDAARRSALLARVNGEAKTRWRAYSARAADRPSLESVSSQAAAFGIAYADLTPREQFNADVYRLAHVDLTQNEDELAKPIRAFVDRASTLGPTLNVDASPVKAFADELAKLASKDQQDDPAHKAGPAIAKLGWKGRSFDQGRRVVYAPTDALLKTLPTTANASVIEFVLLTSEGGRKPFYLSTTEVPVGLLLAVAANRSSDAARLLAGANDGDLSALPGPRAWTLKQGRPAVNAGWLPRDPSVALEARYFQKANVASPSPTSPLQQISPELATWVASSMNCRLPTVLEWRAALALSRETNPNLRDATWKRQADYVRQQNATGLRPPGEGAFPVDGTADADSSIWHAAANSALPTRDGTGDYNDDTLWFRPVPAAGDGVLHDLIGNVAEFVTAEEAATTIRVVGGSALSPPSWDPKTSLPLPQGRDVFADVGFRLAFTSPRTPISIGLPRLLAAYGYLPPSGGKFVGAVAP